MLELRSITKTYDGGGHTTRALTSVDLTVEAGEIFGIIGSSGAGKSTLVRLFNLLERPTSGDVIVDGERISSLEGAALRAARRKIGMVFQQFNLLYARTVSGNVAYPLELSGEYTRAEIAIRVAGLLKRVGLSDHATKYPAQLSGGQKQRVGIARALATQPKVLLCDEATSALDPETTGSVLDLLADINRELGVTIVLITHEMDVVRRVCDRVAVLDHGRVVEIGPVADVFLHPQHAATLALVRESAPDADLAGENGLTVGRGRLVRVTGTGAASGRSIPAALLAAHGVEAEILAGRVGKIRGEGFSQFTVSLDGRDVDGAIRALKATGLHVEGIGAPFQSAAPEVKLHVV